MTVQKKTISVIVNKLLQREFNYITVLINSKTSNVLDQLRFSRFKFISKTVTSCSNYGYYGLKYFENKKVLFVIIFAEMFFFLLSHSLSSDGRVICPFKNFLEICSLSQRMHDVLISISLPFWLWTVNSWNNRFSVQSCTNFLDASTTVNRLMTPSLFPEAST